MRFNMRQLYSLAISALALGTLATSASAQGEPKSMKLEGAPSQTGTGALRCVPNETAQLGLRALDENLNRVLVQEFAPEARSTDARIVVARVTSNAASTVNVLCVGDGEAWITVEAAGLRADIPVLVGTARRKASPKGPHPELAGAVAQAIPATSSAAPKDVSPAPAAPISATPVTRVATVIPAAAPTLAAPIPVPATAQPLSSEPAAASTPPASSQPPTATTGAAAKTNRAASQPRASATADKGGLTNSAPLSAPTGVNATNIGGGEVYVNWTPVPGAAFYHILYHKVGETAWYTLTDVPGAQPPTDAQFQNDAKVTLLPAGTLEFTVFAGRDADDLTGMRSAPVRVAVPRYAGRYRVTVNGLRVNRETIDAPLNYDGQHDEVFVRVGVREYDAEGNAVGPERKAISKTHGDINAERWKKAGTPAYRYYAGSATGLGGLRTGDGVPAMDKPWASGPVSNEKFPLFVWEGDLREGDNTVAIMPVIYEDDENIWELMPETQGLVDAGAWLGARGYELAPGVQSAAMNSVSGGITGAGSVAGAGGAFVMGAVRKNIVGMNKGKVQTFLDKATSVDIPSKFGGGAANANSFLKAAVSRWQKNQQQVNQQTMSLMKNLTAAASLLANTKNRPIGMTGIQGGQVLFEPQLIKLTFETAEEFIATKENPNSDIPAGITTIQYVDTVPGGNGDYTIYIEIKRIQ